MRPIACRLDQSVPHRVEMKSEVEMRREITIVPYQVFPEAALPDRSLPPSATASISLLLAKTSMYCRLTPP